MSEFLSEMAATSRMRAEAVRAADVTAKLASARPPLPLRLSPEGFDLIAEVKPASPAEGRLLREGSERDLAVELGGSDAAALSVLTEPTVFGGRLSLLEEVAHVVDVPVMRKDFLVDPLQVEEARAHSASGVLLIARLLPPSLLLEMVDLILELGMFALVEVFDVDDVERAAPTFDRDVLVGVNARDLTTLDVDQARHLALAPHLPPQLPWVAESGAGTGGSIARAVSAGYRLALVGSALAKSAGPVDTVRDLLATGRRSSLRLVR